MKGKGIFEEDDELCYYLGNIYQNQQNYAAAIKEYYFFLVNIDENNLRRDVFVRQCIGDRRSNASSSNDGNLAAHKYSFLKYP